MKKAVKIIVLAIIVLFVVMVSKDLLQNPNQKKTDQEQNNPERTANIIFDAPKYSRISIDQMNELLGEAKSSEEWNNQTSKGTFQMTIFHYEFDDADADFIVYENAVVKIRLYAKSSWNLISEKKKDVFKLFNIEPKDNVKAIADTGTTWKISPVSDNIAELEVYGIENQTFNMVYFTYNLNYFD